MKKQYHHGNLKIALIEQAIKVLEDEGLAALSLRKVAKQTGVSQAAPYGHFKDKRALLAAVASEGYKRFAQRMSAEAELEPSRHTIGLGKGYVLFALENPALFQLMFGGELTELIDVDALDDSAYESYQLLIDGVEKQPLSRLKGNDHNVDTAVAWSLVHGLANLLLDKRISPQDYGFDNTGDFIDQVLRSSLE